MGRHRKKREIGDPTGFDWHWPEAKEHPAVTLGRARWTSCGKHISVTLTEVTACLSGIRGTCGRPLRPATPEERTKTMEANDKIHKSAYHDMAVNDEIFKMCSKCGKVSLHYRKKHICVHCMASEKLPDWANCNGSNLQSSWTGKKHSCCGSPTPRRHRKGCHMIDGLLPPDWPEEPKERKKAGRPRKHPIRVKKPPRVRVHGTRSCYVGGCRCLPCREADGAYHKARWKSRNS